MYVYVISANERRHKIGIANDPKSRLGTLQIGAHETLKLVHVQEAENARRVEQMAHASLSKFRVRGEWFACTEDQAIGMVGAAMVNNYHPDPVYDAFGGWFHTVGDVVECRHSGEPWLRGELPTPGLFYTVSCLYQGGSLDVAEVSNEDMAFCPSMFWPAMGRRFEGEFDPSMLGDARSLEAA